MANPNSPFGFRPVSRVGGGPWSINQYGKPSTDGNYAIFVNDMCQKAASSVADPTGAGNPMPGVQSGANGSPGTGPWLGPSLNWGAISTATPHYVADEADLIMIAQTDGTTSITTASHVGKNANILLTAGSATTKMSQHTINHTGIATTNSLDFRLIAVTNEQPNAEGVYAIVEVVCNTHFYAPKSTGT